MHGGPIIGGMPSETAARAKAGLGVGAALTRLEVRGSRVLASVLALALAPRGAYAAPVAPPSADEEAVDPPADDTSAAEPETAEPENAEPETAEPMDVGALWRDAQAKLGTADYPGAIVDLTALYEIVVHDPDADALRNRVRIALHKAHVGAYGIDENKEHLLIAIDLLDRSIAALPETETAQREALTTRRDEVQALLDQHVDPTPIPPPTPDPEPRPEVKPEPLEPIVLPPQIVQDPNAGRPLIIAGGVLVGVGLVGSAMMIGGLVSANKAVNRFETEPEARPDARQDADRGNLVGTIGGVVGGVFTVSGAVLLGLGVKKRGVTLTPAVNASTVGLSWAGRF